MRLNPELAENILTKAQAILDRPVTVADINGQLLAPAEYRGQFVPEVLKAAQEGRQIGGTLGETPVKWYPFVYEQQTIGIFGIPTGDSQITPEAISLLSGLAEVITHQHFLLDKMQSSEGVQARFLREILANNQLSAEEVHRQADILQLNLRTPQAVLLALVQGLESAVHARTASLSTEEQSVELARHAERLSGIIRSGFKGFPDNVIAYLGNDRFLILKGLSDDNLTTLNTIRFLTEKGQYIREMLQKTQRNGHHITVGVGQYYPDLGGLRKSYQDAKLALEVGHKVWGAGHTYHIKQVGMYVTLANITTDRKAELAHQILSPLLRDKQLFKTVRTFLIAGLNLTDAAERLHIHRNTLIYRLDKTKKLIGLDPRHFEDALQIKLGLMFYQA